MKAVILTPNEWRCIRDELHKKYPPSYFIRSKMKSKLGFTVREHRDWHPNKDYQKELNQLHKADMLYIEPNRGSYVDEVHLDFYDDRKKSLFLLTYGDKIGFDVA
jgi:hypothetical protein